MIGITIGVDISKDFLDSHRYPDGEACQFTNDTAGFKALIKWIRANVARIMLEPTGPCHGAMERTLAKAGLPIVKVNPRQARRFAEATGRLAKTDRLDAKLLASMGALLKIGPRPVPSEAMAELKQLHGAREALVRDRTAAKTGEEISTFPCSNARTPTA